MNWSGSCRIFSLEQFEVILKQCLYVADDEEMVFVDSMIHDKEKTVLMGEFEFCEIKQGC